MLNEEGSLQVLIVDPNKCTGCHQCELWCGTEIASVAKGLFGAINEEPQPVPRVYEHLNHNIGLNRLSNVVTSNGAVTNFDGQKTLYIPAGTMPVSASTLKGFRDAEEELQVPALTLDTFVERNHISRVDLMKIDTEATEHMVLEGGRNLIRRDEPVIICEVLKGRTEKFLNKLFSALGYNYYWITEQGLIQKETIEGDGTYKYSNYLFCKGEKLSKYGLW